MKIFFIFATCYNISLCFPFALCEHILSYLFPALFHFHPYAFTIVIYNYIKFLRAYSRTRSIFSLRRIAFRFYNFCSCWITRQKARRFSPSPRDCEIIRRASRASVSDFRASQRERALSLFAHISSSSARACACTPRCSKWVWCTYAARALTPSPVAKESISKLRKAVSRVTMRKENVARCRRESDHRRKCTAARWRNSKFCIRTNSSFRSSDRRERRIDASSSKMVRRNASERFYCLICRNRGTIEFNNWIYREPNQPR